MCIRDRAHLRLRVNSRRGRLRYHLAVQQHRGGHCGRDNSFRHPPARRPFQMEPAQGGQIRSRSAAGAKRERREHAGDMISRSYFI